MGYIGAIKRIIIAEDLDELGEAVPEIVPAAPAPAAQPEAVPA